MMSESSTLSYISCRKSKRRGAVDPVLNLCHPQGLVKQLFQCSFGSLSFDFPFFFLMKQKHEQQGSCNKNFIFLLFSIHKCYWKSLCIYGGASCPWSVFFYFFICPVILFPIPYRYEDAFLGSHKLTKLMYAWGKGVPFAFLSLKVRLLNANLTLFLNNAKSSISHLTKKEKRKGMPH